MASGEISGRADLSVNNAGAPKIWIIPVSNKSIPESVTPSVDAGCKSLISICFSKIAGAPLGSPQFLGSKEESMACAQRRDGVTDSGP
jgi:hypothetical protein